jgi:hypothetical protein
MHERTRNLNSSFPFFPETTSKTLGNKPWAMTLAKHERRRGVQSRRWTAGKDEQLALERIGRRAPSPDRRDGIGKCHPGNRGVP